MTTSLTVTAGSDILNKVTHLELCLFRNGRLTVSLFVYSCPTLDTVVDMVDMADTVDMVDTAGDMAVDMVEWKWPA
jgi:hypothetical protein